MKTPGKGLAAWPQIAADKQSKQQLASTTEEGKLDIKVLEPGCPKCQQTEKVVMEIAVAGTDVHVEKVTDAMRIAGYSVFGTPAMIVDGDVKSVDKIPKREEIVSWLVRWKGDRSDAGIMAQWEMTNSSQRAKRGYRAVG